MEKKTAKNRKSEKLAGNRMLSLLDKVVSRLDGTSLRSSVLLSFVGLVILALASWLEGQGSASFLATGAVTALVFFLLWRFSSPDERRFVTAIFSTGFFLRLLALVFFHTLSVKLGYHGFLSQFDAKSYDNFAMFIVRGWHRGEFIDLRSWNLAGTWDIGYYYFLAALYYLFGHSTLLGKAVNCLLGALLPIVIFHLVKSIFSKQVASYSAFLVAIFPNLVYWSAYDLMKDTLAALLLYLSVFFALKVEKKSLVYPVLLVLSLTFLRLNRFYIGTILTGLVMIFFLVKMWREKRIYQHVIVFFVLLLAVEAFLVYGLRFPSFIMPLKSEIPTYFGGKTVTKLVKPESESFKGIKAFIAYFLKNPGQFAKQLIAGGVVFTIGPFAWVVPSSFSWDAFLFPGMWLWYLLIPFALYGLVSVKKEPPVVLLLLVVMSFFFIYAFLFGGGGFRHREQIMPILLVFSAIGLIDFKSWKRFYPYYLGLLVLGISAHIAVRALL